MGRKQTLIDGTFESKTDTRASLSGSSWSSLEKGTFAQSYEKALPLSAMIAQAANQVHQPGALLVSLRLARRHAAVVFLGQTRRAAASAIAGGIIPAPVVFLMRALEA
jgi:hypothetical protein